jgi:mono/diheme cytochrome c family protein/glucose/arabinose dehydrogenase
LPAAVASGKLRPIQFGEMKFLFLLLVWVAPVCAQRGDRAGEVQAPLLQDLNIPPAPPLSVEAALKSFRLQPGFEIQAVASEPMIEAPVEMEFDEAGRMFVLEMRGFMPNVDGKGEDQPIGRVTLLEDTDGDGRMDKYTPFAEGLLMPRAIAVVRGGLLIAEPPHLWFFRDTNGDGKADHKEMVSSDYGSQSNPEHTANGLLWGRDNWIYSANHTVRYRWRGTGWEKNDTVFRGQWGISQDDYGRLFFNSNSDQLRADLVPSEYLTRNKNFKSPFGLNIQIANDQTTFPARVNPGVNRGYQKGILKPEGSLARFTAACGPSIYRGDLFPSEFYGTAFLCEPGANLVRCNFLTEQDGIITATNAFPRAEFLASTDERFRPVNTITGPDGALYIVDMYRGIIQHRMYVTTYLRNQILDRKLETPLNQGRVYRVAPAARKVSPPANLARMNASALVEQLSVTNGWGRDTAQRLLVERGDFVAIPLLERLVARGGFPSAVHALWVLHALNALSRDTVAAAFASPHPKVRSTAVRVSERLLDGDEELQRKVIALIKAGHADVQLQVMLTLGELKTPQAETAMFDLLIQSPADSLLRDAALSGLQGRELNFLNRIAAHSGWREKTPGREKAVIALSRCVAESRDGKSVGDLIEVVAKLQERWMQYAVLDGVTGLVPPKRRGKDAQTPKPLLLPSEPPSLGKLAAIQDQGISERLQKLEPLLAWPGKGGMAEKEAAPLTAEEKRLFEAGKAQYPLICGACHQPNGLGLEGLAPPLAESEWTTGSPERLVRIALNGVRGSINVKGKVWEMEMPPVNILTDHEIAALLTYIRREWGHSASAINPEYVAKIRKETGERFEAWTEPELLKIP